MTLTAQSWHGERRTKGEPYGLVIATLGGCSIGVVAPCTSDDQHSAPETETTGGSMMTVGIFDSHSGDVVWRIREGQPSSLDPGGDGRPCDDIFTIDDVTSYFETPPAGIDSDLCCRDLVSMGSVYGVAVACCVSEGVPSRMDGDGIPRPGRVP